ncbi:DEAD/DEAH box helicase, partial [Streptomyces virginiae]
MNRNRTNDRFARTRNSTAGSGKSGGRFGGSAPSRSGAPGRSGGPSRSGGYGRRPAAVQGEFALPKTITPALPAV